MKLEFSTVMTMGGDWAPIGCSRLILIFLFRILADRTWIPFATAQAIPTVWGRDCTHIGMLYPGTPSGVYTIKPVGVGNPFQVYCEMRPDGGWTVFQRRTGGAVSFRKNWAAYQCGFGDLQRDHWLGLQKLWAITRVRGSCWVLRVELCDFEGGSAFAEYKDFKLGGERQAYRLTVGEYNGTAGDAIRGIDPVHGAFPGIDQNGYGFSSLDRDNDGCSPCIFGDIATNDCSREEGEGGWWYSRCGLASLHGDWHPARDNKGWASGLHWLTWRGPATYSARATGMMVRAL
ncbi:angiopoietin-4-like isoform X1 [Conger conger]|uniref:angiopoietin-4-like isoform X1 n=3 Tax=Conger conger TaxID=82655 RepID=UPI002A59E9BD|nr:angiopoietin-4-like isoform X1 [Conger conger]